MRKPSENTRSSLPALTPARPTDSFSQAGLLSFSFSTRSRDRTGTALLPLVFETSASTNSAIRALGPECENMKNFYLFAFIFYLLTDPAAQPYGTQQDDSLPEGRYILLL